MSVRHVLATASTTLLGVSGFVTPAATHGWAQVSTGAYTMTAGRLWSLIAVALGLAGAVVGGLALARSAGRIGKGNGRQGAVMALVAGVTGAVIGGLVVTAADGGPGTGYGIVGGFVALGVGVIAMLLGGLALARSRRTQLTG
jgi:hypothetical protein